jgi:transposase
MPNLDDESAQQKWDWKQDQRPVNPEDSATASQAELEPRLKRVDRQQLLLRTVDVERLVEPEHLVRAIWELVGRMDLSSFEKPIQARAGEAGRPAWDPRLLISLWIYAYSDGVSSAREIERRCGYHPAYQWLTGLETVNHHTLSDFRVEHRQALDELFAQGLGVLSAEGLITLEQVMHDGTKVKASASGRSFHREATLRAHLEAAREKVRQMGDPRQEEPVGRGERARTRAAREKVERLEQALREMEKVQEAPDGRKPAAERRVSETDPEARLMKHGDGGYAPSHNVQISTDARHGLIVGVRVTSAASDQGQLPAALEEIKRNLGKAPQQVVTDGGFTTRETIMEMAAQQIDYFGGDLEAGAAANRERNARRRGIGPAFQAESFTYDPARDTYLCPAGKEVRSRGSKQDRVGVKRHVYQARAADCGACAWREQCCPGAKRRTLVRSENLPVMAAYLEKIKSEAARLLYRRRAPVAEFPNAWLKAKIGLRQFRVRGSQKARCEVLWACLTYNIQQWFRLCWRTRLTAALA